MLVGCSTTLKPQVISQFCGVTTNLHFSGHVFQQDNAPIHTVTTISFFDKESGKYSLPCHHPTVRISPLATRSNRFLENLVE